MYFKLRVVYKRSKFIYNFKQNTHKKNLYKNLKIKFEEEEKKLKKFSFNYICV